MKIFLSYTLRDDEIKNSDFDKIKKLISSEHKIFIHLHHPNIDSQKKIEAQILNSDILLLVKTQQSFYSKWVLTELKIAQTANIPIFYISIDDLR